MSNGIKKVKNFFMLLTMFVFSFSLIVLADEGESLSLGAKLKNAGFNTIIGLATVFFVLILISFIISLFKYIPRIQNYFEEKKKKKSESSVDKTIEQIVQKEELSNDLELVAVITAAICAATDRSADSFVVRSVKKVRRKG